MLFDKFREEVDRGLKGLNKGIPTGISKLDKVLNGLDRGVYYTIFSEGGTGKSSLAWSIIINLIDYCLEHKIKIKVFLFSLEVVAIRVLAKMLCYKIYKDKKILLDPDYLLSRGDHKPSPKLLDLIFSYKSYFDSLESLGVLEIHDTPHSPQDIFLKVENYALKNGKIDRLTGKYTPNDPNEYTVILTDTVGNLVNTGGSTKQTIDTHSAYCRSTYRDLYNYIPINISHANRAISDPVRAKLGEVFPILSDIKETNMLEQDSSVVLTLFNPYKHMATFKDLQRFMGYDINILRNRFRCIGVLKNRHGADNIRVGLVYHGECGSFSDLPKASEMTADDYKNVWQYKSQSGNSSDTETEV